jgi:VIT1/CCC1 family predicted Fe2+/Mn2+ transporter
MVSSRFDASATPGGVTNIVTNTVTKAYVEGLGIEAGISAETATNIAESVVGATVTGVVRAVSFKVKDYIFDPVTEVCWRRQMVDGFLDYIAVTNIDVTLPENYEALEALERRDNQ